MLPVIFGIASTSLTKDEISLLQNHQIWGIILFTRNIVSKSQTIDLTNNIRFYSQNKNINILIDEEGGRITRLKKIYQTPLKSAMQLGQILTKDTQLGTIEIINNYTEIATRLQTLGINIACSPVADLTMPVTHDIIGDRSFSDNPEIVIKAVKIAADTLLKNNITPIIKHIPGHGRSTLDSHLALPQITTPLDTLAKTDFKVFKNLNSYPLAMTAHIIYHALDNQKPITLSKIAIKYIKTNIAFKGKIITDDISMKALSEYSLKEIISFALQAKCDYILHCNGDFKEMSQIIAILNQANE